MSGPARSVIGNNPGQLEVGGGEPGAAGQLMRGADDRESGRASGAAAASPVKTAANAASTASFRRCQDRPGRGSAAGGGVDGCESGPELSSG